MNKKSTRNQKLKAYSALACSVAAIGNHLDAQIVYTDIADFTGTAGTTTFSYNLDIDNNATNDFQIVAVKSASTSSVQIAQLAAGGAVGWSNSSYPLALNAGDTIDGNKITTWSVGGTLAAWTSGALNYGNWINVSNKYLPLKFNISAQTHYGWARLDVNKGSGSARFTIKDYAYNSVANQLIKASQTVGVQKIDPLLSTTVIRSHNKLVDVEIKNHQTLNGTISVFNLLGEELKTSALQNNKAQFDMNGYVEGVYLVNISINGESVTKKLLIK